MGKENESNAQDPRKRRLLRPVVPFHPRTSGHDQRRSETFGEHHRIRAGAHRRLPNPLRAARPSSRGARSRHEESQAPVPPGIRSASARFEVPEPPGGKSSGFQVQQALSRIELRVVRRPNPTRARLRLIARPTTRFVLTLLVCSHTPPPPPLSSTTFFASLA